MRKIIPFLVFSLLLAGEQINLEKSFKVSPGVKIRVELVSADLSITSWDRDEVRVKVTLKYSGRKPQVIIEGDQEEVFVKIKSSHSGWCFFCEHGRWQGRVEIFAPKDFSPDLHTVSGDIKLKVDKMRDAEIHSVSGDINVEAEGASEVYMETVSGELKTSFRERVKYLKASSVSGDVRISSRALIRVKISTVSGDIGVKSEAGERWCIHSVSGDIDIFYPEKICSLSLKTTGGDIDMEGMRVRGRVERHQCEDGLSIRARTVSGDIVLRKQ